MKGRGGWAGDFKYLTFVVFYGSDKWGVTFICSPKQGGEPARGGEDEKKRGGVEKDLERHWKGEHILRAGCVRFKKIGKIWDLFKGK